MLSVTDQNEMLTILWSNKICVMKCILKKSVYTINVEICVDINKYIWARNDLPVGISNRNIVRYACGKSVFGYSCTAFVFLILELYLQHTGACARQYVCTVHVNILSFYAFD